MTTQIPKFDPTATRPLQPLGTMITLFDVRVGDEIRFPAEDIVYHVNHATVVWSTITASPRRMRLTLTANGKTTTTREWEPGRSVFLETRLNPDGTRRPAMPAELEGIR